MGKIIIYLLLFISVFGESKDLDIYSSSIKQLNFTSKAEKEFNENYRKFENLLSGMNKKNIEYEDLNDADKNLYDSVDETWSNYWQTTTDGCSWYEGGGPIGFGCLSYLGEIQRSSDYLPYYIHDFSYKTAWVEEFQVMALENG